MIKMQEIIQHVNRNGYTHAKVYTGHQDPKGRRALEFIKETSAEDLIERLQEYQKNHHGRYTLFLGETFGAINKSPRSLKVEFTDIEDAQVIGEPQIPVNTAQITAEIEDRIYKRLALEAEEKARQEELEDLRSQVAEFKTGSGKLAHVLQEVISGFMGAGSTTTTPPVPASTLQGSPDEKRKELNEALGILVRELGADTVINLSKKINPSIIGMVKNFANS